MSFLHSRFSMRSILRANNAILPPRSLFPRLTAVSRPISLARHYATFGSSPKADFMKMSWKSFAVLLVSGAGLLGYFEYKKKELEIQREASKNQSYGRPKVGGPWSLVDHHGRPVTDLDFAGKYMLLYFGYTFCPDVCPEELDRMALIVDAIDKALPGQDAIVPLFISCDPKRDSVESIAEYVKEFHPKFLGLTGTYQQIKRIAKTYRLYFSAPPLALDDDAADYLVDHSIFFYLVGPDGKYIAHFGRQDSVEKVTSQILSRMNSPQSQSESSSS